MTPKIFGLTGGIASGKSTVGKRFSSRLIPVIDADQIAREIVAPGTPALSELVHAFGPAILEPGGELDRKALSALAFSDETHRTKLNAITHPRIAQATQTQITKLHERGEPIICYEAALLVENGLADSFRPLVVVSAPESTQVQRAMQRDGYTEAEARARVAAQMPLAEKLRAADVVIENNASLPTLEARADAALDAVLRLLGGVDPNRYPAPLLT